MKAVELLERAAELVGGDRQEDYGTMEQNLGNIADLWSAYLSLREDFNLTAEDVAWMMVLLKIARAQTGNKEDNYVDACGYAAIAGQVT